MISPRAQQIINDAQNRAIARSNPLLKDLPSWVEGYREGQVNAVKAIMSSFEDNDVVVLDAPTGTGKTLIAETVRRLMKVRGLYVCNSKQLQDQFVGDFKDASVLKGRSNYTPTNLSAGWEEATCADCSKNCDLCLAMDECPYIIAKGNAIDSDVAVLNTAYFLTECNGMNSSFSGRGLVVMDEADTLESEVMRYVGVDISRARCLRYGLREPKKVTVADSWREWMDYAIPRVEAARRKVRGTNLRSQRERAYLTRLLGNLRRIAPNVEEGWVYTGKNGAISFKPVTVDEHGKRALWRHGRKFLLMSASIISSGDLLANLGYDGTYGAVNVASTFPIENRKVKIVPSANMSRNANELEKLTRALLPILARHRRESVLLHCVSYELAQHLYGELSGSCGALGMECSTYHGSDGKADALAAFREEGGHLLIAPSMDRGVDLPDEQCRVIIIAKVPYPYLGDRQVNARLHSRGGQVWYNVQTVRSIVQMTGRGVRHENDYCVSYILDTQFDSLWSRGRSLFPRWWVEALEWER